jgi:hypothetical protein
MVAFSKEIGTGCSLFRVFQQVDFVLDDIEICVAVGALGQS